MFKLLKNKNKTIKIISAIDIKNGIGKNGNLLFSIKEDMEHFTKKTTGNVVIMGSTTYESIPKKFRPLKNRINIILNREKKKYSEKNIFVISNIQDAIDRAKRFKKEIWVIGGASIYKQMLNLADELEITQIFAEKNADTFFPEFKKDFRLRKKSKKYFDEKEKVFYQFQTWERK